MIRPQILLGVALAEARLTRRLARFWVFQSLAFLLGVIGLLYYAFLHRQFSHYSATVALLNPRYLIGFIGIYYLVVFLIGLVFLGYDLRARDTRDRMSEVLDALPVTNVELLAGRFLGLMIPAWLPVALATAVLPLVGLTMGESIEPWSLATFALWMAIPAYTFILGLTFLLTLLLRHRLLAAIVLLAIIAGLLTLNFGLVPVYMLPLVDLTGGFSLPAPSDILPRVVDARGAIQRTGLMLIGLGLLGVAAAVHPRRDDARRSLPALVGLALVLAGIGLCGSLVLDTRSTLAERDRWKAAHTARRDEAAPDLVRLAGVARIDPGSKLDLDLELRFRAPEGAALERALFSLNPGLDVTAVEDGAGKALDHTWSDGLLDVRLAFPVDAGGESALHLRAAGRPAPFFAYLDSVFEPFRASIREGNVFLLGFLPTVFERQFVALMPGTRWLPAAGAEIGRDDPNVRPTDFFDLDLTVELPAGWLAAGPGRREEAGGAEGGRTRFRWAPPLPVPAAAVVAGRFVARDVEVDGVQLELLLHPKHERVLETLAPAGPAVRDWIAERLADAGRVGLAYPYGALTLVEVPGALRGYGGGWRMDSTLQQPGLVLMREAGFPTARFDVPFKDPKGFEDHEGGLPRAMREDLERFFETDLSGGNPFLAASRSFFSFQTAGRGPAGVPLDHVWQDLATRLVSDKQGFFSIHHYGQDLNQAVQRVIGAIFQNEGESSAEVMIRALTSRPAVWDALLGVSLVRLDPWAEPRRATDVLVLKGGAMARSMLDGMGRERAASLLATLREQHGGGAYTRDDVVTAGASAGEDLAGWLDTWIDATALPGFTLGDVHLDRISESGGTPRYQLRVVVRNEEAVAGLLRLEYRAGDREHGEERGASDPVQVPSRGAVEIGLVTNRAPSSVRVAPYLALNRDPFSVSLPAVDEEKLVEAEPWTGSREVPWSPPSDEAIVVDDLDPGFRVEEKQRGSARFAGSSSEVETDAGLPVDIPGSQPYRWSRRLYDTAWGKYRHTAAVVRGGGRGDHRAVFEVELPRSGRWEVEYHVPPVPGYASDGGRSRLRGKWSLQVIDSSGSHDVGLDADAAEAGWNSLGSFELARGAARVEVSDATEGRIVIADAVRLRPSSAGEARAAAGP